MFQGKTTRAVLTCWTCVGLGVYSPGSTATRSGWGLWCHWAAVSSHTPPYTSQRPHPPLLSDTRASTENWTDWEEEKEHGVTSYGQTQNNKINKQINKDTVGTHPMLFSKDTAPHISLPRLRLRGYAWQDWHLPLLEHTPCTLRAASLSICSLGFGLA